MTMTMTSKQNAMTLKEHVLKCTKCDLHLTRTNVVYNRGNMGAPLWFMGEAPGKDEDEQGLAFVGRAGQLLDLCLHTAKIKAPNFNIVNVLKCRPPDNRNPTEAEVMTCVPWLIQQLDAYMPKIIVAMGRFSIGMCRGYSWKKTKDMRVGVEISKPPFVTRKGRIVLCTYHPAYILRNGEPAVHNFIETLIKARLTIESL